MDMTYIHMSGAGNTFLVADARANDSEVLSPRTIRDVIARNPRGDMAAIEGVLILRACGNHWFEADYYNPDGSYGMMCANGSRCIVRFALDHGVEASNDIAFTLNQAPYHACVNNDGTVSVRFPAPLVETHYMAGELKGVDVSVTYVNVHSDHVVIDGPLDTSQPIVQTLRHHPIFERGTNVNIVNVCSDGTVNMATFERGVEAVTGACGTGALSAAVTLWRQGRVDDHVRFNPPSGRPLDVFIKHRGDTITELILQGDAQYDNV